MPTAPLSAGQRVNICCLVAKQRKGSGSDFAHDFGLAAFIVAAHRPLRMCVCLRSRVSKQYWSSFAGENGPFGRRIHRGERRGLAVAAHCSRNISLLPRRHLCIWDGPEAWRWRVGNRSLAPSQSPEGPAARAVFQASWRQGSSCRPTHPLAPAYRGQLAGGYGENAMAHFPFLWPDRIGGLGRELLPHRLFPWKKMDASGTLAGSDNAVPDFRWNRFHHPKLHFEARLTRAFGPPSFQKQEAKARINRAVAERLPPRRRLPTGSKAWRILEQHHAGNHRWCRLTC